MSGKSRIKAAIEISPLCRMTEFNLAEDIIRNGLTTGNVADFHQQQLGLAYAPQATSLRIEDVKRSIYAPRYEKRPDVIIAGCDFGRSSHWLMVLAISLPLNWKEMNVQQIIENSIQTVRFGGSILRTELVPKLNELNVQFGLLDNEPDTVDAAEICRHTTMEMADQKTTLLDACRKSEVQTGGSKFPCWFINQQTFLKQVLNIFLLTDANGDPLIRCPTAWETWLGNPSELSPIRHLTSPSYDPDTGAWKRGDKIDDLFYAAHFAQAAFYIWLTEKAKNSVFAAGLGKVKHDHVPLKRDRSSMMII